MYELERLERNTKFIHTYVGHRFVAVDVENDDEVILDHVVEFNGIIGIKNHVNPHENRDIKKAVQNTMGGEWRKHLAVTRTFRWVLCLSCCLAQICLFLTSECSLLCGNELLMVLFFVGNFQFWP